VRYRILVAAALFWLFSPTSLPPPATARGAPVSIDGRQFLEYDTRGDGRVVEAIGDLAGADRVAIIVPGVDNRLDNFDRGLGGVRRRAPAFEARQLYGQLRAVAPDVPTAVVAWLGYDPPEGVGRDAMREDRAAAGAVALRSFVDGLVAARPGVVITVIGHSYGSVVAGLAAPALSPRVENLVAIGSPGMGVDRAADLHTRARVFAGTAPHDWTRWVPGIRLLGAGHGTRPTDPSFGALPLPVGGVDDHDGYFVSGTAALQAMAEITLGRR
jgi:pimeloyl-ACP methyl ester carboxylesterase